MELKTTNELLEAAIAEGIGLVSAIERAMEVGVYIPKLAERAIEVADVLKALVAPDDEPLL